MTELEQAVIDNKRIKELDVEIANIKKLQVSAMKANDNIVTKVWADVISVLKAERSALDRQHKYTRFSIFTQVVKTYLTKDQFNDCWNRVEEILERPELMQ